MGKYFTYTLMHWHETENKRIMPWKGEKDPYKIWLSEVILQQTRVAQGLGYYMKFLKNYPTINALAKADDTDVFKAWEGLGYYSRCRNLLRTARKVVEEYDGVFPKEYHEILKLQGIGPYTAAAIASFAFNAPAAVVDGNVLRVLARFFGKKLPIDTSEGRKYFSELAQKQIDTTSPALYNQAIMDFGATICTPKNPGCALCPLQQNCKAFKTNSVEKLPVKLTKLTKKHRFFTYLICRYNNGVLIKQRLDKDIWQHLHEYFLYESEAPIGWTTESAWDWFASHFKTNQFTVVSVSKTFTQQLTHQCLRGQFIEIQLHSLPAGLQHLQLVSESVIKDLAFPKFITQYMQQKAAEKLVRF